MFKGMQKGIILVCLLMLSVTPAVYASEPGNEARPWITISSIVSDIFNGFQQALGEMWAAFELSESEPAEVPPGSDGGAAQAASSEPPPPNPPAPENDDDGNIGGGQEPWG